VGRANGEAGLMANYKNLPETVNEYWNKFKEEVATIQYRWDLYLQVYGSKENVEIINYATGSFFCAMQDVILQYIEQALAKFYDPAEFRKRNEIFKNLSLDRLEEDIKTSGAETDFSNRLSGLILSYKDKCSCIKNMRNKYYSHYDLDTLLVKELEFQSINNINECLQTLRTI